MRHSDQSQPRSWDHSKELIQQLAMLLCLEKVQGVRHKGLSFVPAEQLWQAKIALLYGRLPFMLAKHQCAC